MGQSTAFRDPGKIEMEKKMDAPIGVGTEKQLFIDDRWFANSYGVSLRVNPPLKSGRILVPEMPMESGGFNRDSTIVEHEGEIKFFYNAFLDEPGFGFSTHLATSTDGVHFERRNVGLFEWGGSRDNNLVLPGAGGGVMVDPRGPEEERYKMMAVVHENEVWPEAKKIPYIRTYTIYMCVSPDGIHWKLLTPAASPFLHDTHNQIAYDTRIGKYVAYVRTHERSRTVSRVEFDDPLKPFPYDHTLEVKPGPRKGTFSPPRGVFQPVIFCDESDPSDTDVYTPCVHQYPWAADAYFSFAPLYRHYPQIAEYDTLATGEDERGRYKNDGPVDVQLAVSRDGINWRRPDRRPYLPLGLKGSWEGGEAFVVLGMVRRGDEIFQYYWGAQHTHGRGTDDVEDVREGSGFGRLVQRLDGFVSADAEYTGGEFTTPLIVHEGSDLRLNIDCSALGEAWVEIRDENNLPIPGYTLEESVSIDRNQIAAPVRWKNRESVGELAGRPVKLHFKLRACKLYAFQVCQG